MFYNMYDSGDFVGEVLVLESGLVVVVAIAHKDFPPTGGDSRLTTSPAVRSTNPQRLVLFLPVYDVVVSIQHQLRVLGPRNKEYQTCKTPHKRRTKRVRVVFNGIISTNTLNRQYLFIFGTLHVCYVHLLGNHFAEVTPGQSGLMVVRDSVDQDLSAGRVDSRLATCFAIRGALPHRFVLHPSVYYVVVTVENQFRVFIAGNEINHTCKTANKRKTIKITGILIVTCDKKTILTVSIDLFRVHQTRRKFNRCVHETQKSSYFFDLVMSTTCDTIWLKSSSFSLVSWLWGKLFIMTFRPVVWILDLHPVFAYEEHIHIVLSTFFLFIK
jgi:hypothetical protein